MFANTHAMPRRPSLSDESFHREFVRPARPVVIPGSAGHWPALHAWTGEYFRSHFGSRPIEAYRVRNGDLVFDARTGLVPETIPFRSFLDQLDSSEPAQHRIRSRIFEAIPALMRDIEIPAYCRDRLKLEANLWFSASNTRSQLHFDQPHSLFAQVRGTKRVLLFAPDEARNLYPHPVWSAITQFSRVDLANPDFARFPRLRDAHAMQCTLEPGDTLFIPSRWWHYIESRDVTISVSFRWWPWRSYPALLAADVYKRLRGHVR